MIDILVVEDNDAYNEYLKLIFEREGYSVQTATSAEEVLSYFKKDMFSVAVLDLGLIGIHGVDLCIELRKIDKSIIAYALTEYTEVFDDISPQVAGFDDAYKKANLAELLKQVAIVLKDKKKV